MLNLQRFFLYRLKNPLRNDFVKETHVLVGSKFPVLPEKSTAVYQGYVHKLDTSIFSDVFLDESNFYIPNNPPDSPGFSSIHISSMKKINLK